jgi:phosphate transport system protein
VRDVFHHDLQALADQLIEMSGLVGSAIASATQALLDADLALAESVIAADVQVDRLQRDLDERAVHLLARQQPVATDLRVVVSALRMSSTLERAGDLARHVAQLARLRFPHHAVPDELRDTFAEMGRAAEDLCTSAGRLIANRDLELAARIAADDDRLDDLHRHVFTTLLDESWSHPVETTVDVTLCSRFYERFGDHCVSVARRVAFLVTGEDVPLGHR